MRREMRLCLAALLARSPARRRLRRRRRQRRHRRRGRGLDRAVRAPSLYATINTDVDSDQVDQLEELLAKFPDREKLLAELEKSLAEEDLSWETDIKPALGDTLDVVLLDFEGERRSSPSSSRPTRRSSRRCSPRRTSRP